MFISSVAYLRANEFTPRPGNLVSSKRTGSTNSRRSRIARESVDRRSRVGQLLRVVDTQSGQSMGYLLHIATLLAREGQGDLKRRSG